MIRHILCPSHEEDTPSCAIYPDGYYHCFGCGAHGRLEEIGLDAPKAVPKIVEDMDQTFEYIDTLPIGQFRGLEFPYDEKGFFIVWPDRSYYKYRYFQPKKGKYKNPSGHPQTLLWARHEKHPTLVIVEGEINALSIAKAVPGVDVMSPGAAGNFKQAALRLNCMLQYATLLVIVDKDAAGAEAAIEIMSRLNGRAEHIKAHLMSPDANEVLVGSGSEKLRQEITTLLG